MNSPCGKLVRRFGFLCGVCGLLLSAPTVAGAMEVRLNSQTLLLFMQRNTSTSADASVIPLYEYLQADIGARSTRGLSFHFYGWAREDLNDSDYYKDNPDGELLYGYLNYSRPFNNLNLRLGRQYVIGGLANNSIDGLSLQTDLGPDFVLSIYGGLPVAFDTTAGRSGDSIFGGRLVWHSDSLHEVGLSYQKTSNDGSTEDQRLGLDLTLALPAGVNLSGRSTYNLESDGFGENFYEARFALSDFNFRTFFENYTYADYFAPGKQTPNPFYVLNRGGEAQTNFGGDVVWRMSSDWEFGAKTKFYTYDVNSSSAAYYSGLITWHGQDLTQIGGEVGTMQGDAADNKYILSRAFFYWDRPAGLPLAFISGDLLYAAYDQPIYGQDNSFFASLGAGQRFLDDRLELKLSGDYSSDPYFDSDLRTMLVANYRFDY